MNTTLPRWEQQRNVAIMGSDAAAATGSNTPISCVASPVPVPLILTTVVTG
jgi:hypothetical protein